MKVLVTGATGFIGIPLTLKLAEKGYIVHALCRSRQKTIAIQHPNVKVFFGNVTDKKSVEQAVAGCTYVYHVAAFAKVWHKDPDIFDKINVTGSLNVINVALLANVKRIVVTSTAGVMGPSVADIRDENSTNTVFFTDYERSKARVEEVVRQLTREEGCDIVIVNPSRVYGPGLLSESNGVTLMMKRYIEGKWHFLPGSGMSKGNYVYIDDVVDGHMLAMEYGVSGERYILGGDNVSYRRFFEILRQVSGKKYKLIGVPLPVMLFVAQIMLLTAKISGTSPMIVPALVKKFNHNWNLSSSKAEKTLGYRITSLKKGMQRTLKWLTSNNNQT